MTEIRRIAHMLKETFETNPYYGPSILGVLKDIRATIAVRKPTPSVHSIWEIVLHLTAELKYALDVVQGTAKPWGDMWPEVIDTSEAAWEEAVVELRKANQALVRAVENLNDSILDQTPVHVRGPFYTMLHGTMQHTIYHSGQIAILKKQ